MRLGGLFMLLVLSSPVSAVVPEDWRQSAYGYEASQTPLETVLKDFANAYGVGLSLSGVSGVVDAKLRAANAEEFLDRLAWSTSSNGSSTTASCMSAHPRPRCRNAWRCPPMRPPTSSRH